ncbi:MAG: tetratricopeptide repeat protein [Polyangiaceae bacterium]
MGGPAASSASANTPPENAGPASEDLTKGIKAYTAGDMAGAKASFEAAIKKNPKDADAFCYLGLVADKGGDKAAAEKSYKDALALKPDHEDAAQNLGALYIDGGRFDEALLATRPALAKHPKNAALHTNIAVALASKGDVGAVREFEEATKIAPTDAMLEFTYGHWLGVMKRPDEAAAKLRAARPLAGDDIALVAAIGHEMLLIRDVADCVPTYDKAISLKDAAEFRTERALCKLAGKDEDGAFADLQAAVKKEPTYALAHYWLATRLAPKGKWAQVVTEFETYLKLAPTGPLAAQAKERLKVAHEKAGGKK